MDDRNLGNTRDAHRRDMSVAEQDRELSRNLLNVAPKRSNAVLIAVGCVLLVLLVGFLGYLATAR